MNNSSYLNWLHDLNIGAIEKKNELLLRFKELFLEHNRKVNLVSRASCDRFDINHMLDSLSLLPLIQAKIPPQADLNSSAVFRIMDLGTGGGLPGMPLAICLPRVHFVLMDSIGKKIEFVQSAVRELKLNNVEVRLARAEDVRNDEKMHHKFDVITSRAFGDMDLIIELTFPLLKPDGVYLLPRGSKDDSVIVLLEDYLQRASGRILGRHRPLWQDLLGNRSILEISPGKGRKFNRKSYQRIKQECLKRKERFPNQRLH